MAVRGGNRKVKPKPIISEETRRRLKIRRVRAWLAKRVKAKIQNGKPVWSTPANLDNKVFTDQEMCRLWDTINSNLWPRRMGPFARRWKPAFFAGLLLATGMRRNEAVQLRPEDCDTPIGGPCTIRIRPETAKGLKGRVIGIFPDFEPEFRKRLEWLRRRERPFLFYASGSIWDPCPNTTNFRWCKNIMQWAGVRTLNPHSFRHTFATWMLRVPFEDRTSGRVIMGMPLPNLMAQLGHASMDTTSIYQHPTADMIFPVCSAIEWPDHVVNKNFRALCEDDFDF